MERLSIRLDPELAAWIRRKARAQRLPLSRVIGETLRVVMQVETRPEGFPKLPQLDVTWKEGRRPSRAELYESRLGRYGRKNG